ncbi:head GIN domain-containing protein [Yeosuana sp. MJ-SS3]|jgi:hypothetical protein|uniref:Head GIN domain-containing protein n=1 Tax=Gilvirhabdus luticola TaxID=3079858 RepID=A0ABU3U9I4_9FLAO|nr:head GIN domain-containing protein [Yeosuana sp. MJ-SS3]MDU8887080.1 head GIN domain-containing protein [Yeosuana sp. MJ-SS3]
MKTIKFKTFVILLMSIIIASCTTDEDCITGNGTIITETIPLAIFSGIRSSGTDHVIISQSNTQEVTVTGHRNIINKLKRSVSNGVWKAELEDGCYRNSQLEIHVKVPEMNYVRLVGSGSILVKDFVSQDYMEVILEGSGSIDLNANQGAKWLDVLIEGSGTITGFKNFEDLENLDIEIYGSGNFDAFPVVSNSCEIYVEGSGNCNVSVEDYLDVIIEGSSVISYKGYPSISSRIDGSGSVQDTN